MALSSGPPLISRGPDGKEGLGQDDEDVLQGQNDLEGQSDLESDDGSEMKSDGEEDPILRSTLRAEGLVAALAETQTSNELGLVRSEVRRLRAKVQTLEQEKDDMAEDFRNTTKVLLNRIKDLTEELEGVQNRPQTAAVIERIEGGAGGGRLSRPPLPRGGSSGGPAGASGGGARSRPHAPEVLRIEEEPSSPLRPSSVPSASGEGFMSASSGGGASPKAARGSDDDGLGGAAGDEEPAGGGAQAAETSLCGNCRRHIPACNVLAHSVSCYRNNYHCASCDQVIPLREKDGHIAEWTDPVKLLEATARRDLDKLQLMFSHGADATTAIHPETNETVMHVAARLADVDLIGYFMGFGVDVDPVNSSGETPLHLAAENAPPNGEAAAVKFLVELGAKLNATNGRGESALMLVCRRGFACAAQYLVENRADAEAQTRLGDTPLQIAQRNGHQETVLALCRAGAQLRPGTPSRARSGSPMPHKVAAPAPAPAASAGGGGGGAGRGGYPPLPRTR